MYSSEIFPKTLIGRSSVVAKPFSSEMITFFRLGRNLAYKIVSLEKDILLLL